MPLSIPDATINGHSNFGSRLDEGAVYLFFNDKEFEFIRYLKKGNNGEPLEFRCRRKNCAYNLYMAIYGKWVEIGWNHILDIYLILLLLPYWNVWGLPWP